MNQMLIQKNQTLNILLILFFCLDFFLISAAFSQGMVPDFPLETRIDESDHIFEGNIVSKKTVWDIRHENLFTIYNCELTNVLKGADSPDSFFVIIQGGMTADFMQIVNPSLKLKIGQTGMFFLKKSDEKPDVVLKNPVYEPQFSTLSFIQYDQRSGMAFDPYTRYSSVQKDIYSIIRAKGLKIINPYIPAMKLGFRSPNAVNITSFSPTTITAGTQSELTIIGTGFGDVQGSGKVEFEDADNGGFGTMSPLASEYVSWSNTQIVVEVPNDAGTGFISVTNDSDETGESSTGLTVSYNLINLLFSSNAYRPNLVDIGSGGIELEFQTDFYNDTDALNAFVRGVNTWRCSNESGTGIYFIDGGSTTVDELSNDGTNVVRFSDNSELNGALAVTVGSYGGCNSSGNWLWYLVDVDLAFDETPSTSSYSWNFDEADGSTGNFEFDFESVSVHELGHAHLIDHSISSGDVMHYSIGGGDEIRAINDDEYDAGDDVLTFSSGVCGQDAMISGYICTVTQLDILDFSGDLLEDKIDLIAEINSDNAIHEVWLEKSENGSVYKIIGLMEMTENKDVYHKYEKEDLDLSQHNYYRLKTIDEDGNVVFSDIIYLQHDLLNGKVNCYPNPVTDKLQLVNGMEEVISLKIITPDGRTIYEIDQMQSQERISADLSTVPAGLYILHITSMRGKEIRQVIKK